MLIFRCDLNLRAFPARGDSMESAIILKGIGAGQQRQPSLDILDGATFHG